MPPKKRTKASHVVASAQAESSSAGKSNSVVTRRSAATRRNLRVQQGGLKDMPKMPLDVLIEIFRFLHPRDLLNLARTSKDFRALLLNRSSALFWKTSRKQIEGLPEIPDHVSEPAYANLLFCNHCHICLKTGINVSVYWDIAARYCSGCRATMIATDYAEDDMLQELAEEYDFDDATDIMTPVYQKNTDRYGYHIPELEEFKKIWSTLKEKDDREEKVRYLRERQSIVLRRKEHAQEMRAWEDLVKQNALAEDAAIVAERRAAVLAKLRDEGWGEDLDQMSSKNRETLLKMNVVCRSSKLTHRSWSVSRATIIEFMEKIRSDRINAEQTALLSTRFKWVRNTLADYQHMKWAENKAGFVFIGLADCAMDEEIRAVIGDTSEDLTEESAKAQLRDLVPTVVARLVDARRAELTALLLKALGEDSAAARAPDLLALAISWFNCTYGAARGCSGDLRWPHVLDHLHFREGGAHWREDSKDPYMRNLSIFLDSRTWWECHWNEKYEGRHVCADKRLAHVRDIISTCGADPDTATFAQMEDCSARLVCRVCATLLKREVFDWKAAIAHDFETHYGNLEKLSKPLAGRWLRIPEEYASTAKTLEAAALAEPVKRYSSSFTNTKYHCAWCPHQGTIDEIRYHTQSDHGRNQPLPDEDFYLVHRERARIWMFSDLLSESSVEKAAVEEGTAFFVALD